MRGRINRLSFRWRIALMTFAVLALSGELIGQRYVGSKFYSLYIENLELIAITAVKTGAKHLPTDPNGAVRIADTCAEGLGIAKPEIVFTKVSADDTVLSMRLDRTIPLYVAVLALGRLPTRHLSVTATASGGRPSRGSFTEIMIDGTRRPVSMMRNLAGRLLIGFDRSGRSHCNSNGSGSHSALPRRRV